MRGKTFIVYAIHCEVCGRSLPENRWRFCSNECSRKFYVGNLNTICACGKLTKMGERQCKACKRKEQVA